MLEEYVVFGRPVELPDTTNNARIPKMCPCCSDFLFYLVLSKEKERERGGEWGVQKHE
jgi:hypothetical protein